MSKNSLKVVLIGLIILLIVAVFFLISNPRITGNFVNEKMETKAICENNYCEDYEITYKNDKINSIKSTGFGVWR
ncbi:MAG: hypothetical protein KC516_04225 [Nanoarchaeota archaeon]|nr:hypothetical protein [Nanoarchaeota archaeon]